MADYTTDALLDEVKQTGQVPTVQALITDAQILDAMDKELKTELVPSIMSVMEEYFVTSSDITVTAGTTSYAIPSRAVGAKLRGVFWVGADGALLPVPRISLKFSNPFTPMAGFSPQFASSFRLQGNSIVFSPALSTSGTVRVFYYKRPSALVLSTSAAQATAVNTGTNKITVASYPAAWTTGTSLDAIQNFPHFDNVWTSLAIVGITGAGPYDIEVSDVGDMAVGDWLALAGETPVPQLPLEAHTILAMATAITLLRQFADAKGVDILDKEYRRKLENLINIMNARVDSEAKTIIPDGIGRSFNRFYPWTR